MIAREGMYTERRRRDICAFSWAAVGGYKALLLVFIRSFFLSFPSGHKKQHTD
jgi:hypothetical protein